MKIGFIGFGEAAFNLATGLKSEGLTGFLLMTLWKTI